MLAPTHIQSNTQFHTWAPAYANTDTHTKKDYNYPICDLSAAVQECVDGWYAAVTFHQRTDRDDYPSNSHSWVKLSLAWWRGARPWAWLIAGPQSWSLQLDVPESIPARWWNRRRSGWGQRDRWAPGLTCLVGPNKHMWMISNTHTDGAVSVCDRE